MNYPSSLALPLRANRVAQPLVKAIAPQVRGFIPRGRTPIQPIRAVTPAAVATLSAPVGAYEPFAIFLTAKGEVDAVSVTEPLPPGCIILACRCRDGRIIYTTQGGEYRQLTDQALEAMTA